MVRKKSGSVYFLRSTRASGKRKTYTGSTIRSVSTRVGEHKKSIGNKKSWVGRGTSVKLIGSFPSRNPRKAETTIKKRKSKRFG